MNIIIILELLRQLGKILIAVKPMIKESKDLLSGKRSAKDLQKALELQISITEQLENQLKIVQSVLLNVQKSILFLTYMSCGAAILGITAIILWILK
jgi:hypothetical protein